MRKVAASLLFGVALLFARASAAQAPADDSSKIKKEGAAEGSVTAPLCVGTAFNATLTDPIDTGKAKTGDVVTSAVAEDVSYERTVVFPKGTKIVGHIIRATSGRGRAGSALFLQFEKAVLEDGEEITVNAGIQALAVTPATPQLPDSRAIPEKQAASEIAVQEGALQTAPVQVVSTIYDAPAKQWRDPLSPLPQGEVNAEGLFTPDSRGAFGRPDIRIYTPTSEGSQGTVLLSVKKHLRLDGGTHLLLVVQPPAMSAPGQ